MGDIVSHLNSPSFDSRSLNRIEAPITMKCGQQSEDHKVFVFGIVANATRVSFKCYDGFHSVVSKVTITDLNVSFPEEVSLPQEFFRVLMAFTS